METQKLNYQRLFGVLEFVMQKTLSAKGKSTYSIPLE
jgi:hypothetical protein